MILRTVLAPKNVRVSFLRTQNIFMRSIRPISTIIQPPTNRQKPEPVVLNIGDHAILEREFSKEDIQNFAIAAKDENAAHLSEENSKEFFKKDVVYGIFTSSMFTILIRDLFPGAIYLGHTIKFTSPVFAGNKLEAKMTVKEIREDKKIVIFNTIVTNKESNQVAITGEGTFLLPQLKVSIENP